MENTTSQTKMKESKKLIKFEMTELQYLIVKDSLRAAQVLLREESEQAARPSLLKKARLGRCLRILSTQYDNNWKVQQLMADQFFDNHNANA
tara:strand:- start:9957 stop:10232 length:276 start_codon:yes stop_codon:yes gene_type:complete